MDPIFPPDALFEIGDGVHRSVAAREAGLPGVLAIVYRDGQPPVIRVIDLERLYSPKTVIGRWDKERDVYDMAQRLRTPVGRAAMERITVTQITEVVAERLTRLLDVIVSEEEQP